MKDANFFNQIGATGLPGTLGMVITEVNGERVCGHMAVSPAVMAPNGYLHAGSIVALADTCAGYGCVALLPEGARGFTTLELKSNHLGTAVEGTLDCVARPAHSGGVPGRGG